VERKTEDLHACRKVVQETFRLMVMLESKDEVVSLADNDHITLGMTISPLLCPQVQEVVQIRVGKQRRYHNSLRITHRDHGPSSSLRYSGPEPFPDEAEHPSVGDPMLEETKHPFAVYGIEETTDVRIEQLDWRERWA
jgi:hypothetical protein